MIKLVQTNLCKGSYIKEEMCFVKGMMKPHVTSRKDGWGTARKITQFILRRFFISENYQCHPKERVLFG